MTTIYLIRHGQASFGAASYDLLSARGEQQAVVVGEFLQRILPDMPYVEAGSMQRHQQTAQGALQGWPNSVVHTEPGWNEFDHQQVLSCYDPRFNHPELLKQDMANYSSPRAYLAEIFEAAIARWTDAQHDQDYTETWPQFQQRVQQAMQQLCTRLTQQQPRYAVVFSSGGVIANLIGQLLGLDAQHTFRLNWAIANASVTSLRWQEGKLELLSINEHHFLKAHDPQLLTWI
jgi:broad specificity phosphatase PhoE